jgi:ABC-type uncharacterized transport system permease subunit
MSRTEVFLRWLAARSYLIYLVMATILSLVTNWWWMTVVSLLLAMILAGASRLLDDEGKQDLVVFTSLLVLMVLTILTVLALFIWPGKFLIALVFTVAATLALVLSFWPEDLMQRMGFSKWEATR